MNEILKAIHERRSVKRYTTEMPSKELVEAVVEAGLWAPNGMGVQDTRLLVVKNKGLRDRLSRLNCQVGGWGDTDPFYGAPVVIAVLAKRGTSHYVHDGSLVMGNMMLAAHSLGLGSCWIHRCKEVFELEEGKQILEDFGLSAEDWEGVGNLILGYPEGEPRKAAERKTHRVVVAE